MYMYGGRCRLLVQLLVAGKERGRGRRREGAYGREGRKEGCLIWQGFLWGQGRSLWQGRKVGVLITRKEAEVLT